MAEPITINIADTLAARGSRYGKFSEQSKWAQLFNDIFDRAPNWPSMAADQKEALRIIATKISRILYGDPDYSDSWHDIVGYSKLVDDRLQAEGK